MKIHESVTNNIEKLPKKKVFEYVEGGEVIGSAILYLREKPFCYYSLSNFRVDTKRQGSGIGSKLIEDVKSFSIENNIPIFLFNAPNRSGKIPIYNIKTKEEITIDDFYKNHGWKSVPDHEKFMIFGKDDLSEEEFREMTPWEF